MASDKKQNINKKFCSNLDLTSVSVGFGSSTVTFETLPALQKLPHQHSFLQIMSPFTFHLLKSVCLMWQELAAVLFKRGFGNHAHSRGHCQQWHTHILRVMHCMQRHTHTHSHTEFWDPAWQKTIRLWPNCVCMHPDRKERQRGLHIIFSLK